MRTAVFRDHFIQLIVLSNDPSCLLGEEEEVAIGVSILFFWQ
jgi:hypothetical protein